MKYALNGINLGVLMAAGTAPTEKVRDIGGESRVAADGTTRQTRLKRKKDLSFKTVPLTAAMAHAWLSLLTGEGESWSFDSTLYGSKGTGPSSSVAASVSAGSAKYGAGKLSLGATTGAITFTGAAANSWGSADAWSVLVWKFEGGAWHHYMRRSDATQWFDGISIGGSSAWLDVTGSNVRLQNPTGVTQLFDDLVILPFIVADAWLPQIIAAARAYSAVPVGLLTGDLVTEGSSREVLGTAEEAQHLVTAEGVLKTLSVELAQR